MFVLALLALLLVLGVSSESKNAYKILGVTSNAGARQIKKAFREATKKWHPDLNKDNQKEAEEKFRDIVWAHDILSNETLRNAYDKYGEEGVKNMCK